jgi:hypothetical protein
MRKQNGLEASIVLPANGLYLELISIFMWSGDIARFGGHI